MIEIGLAKAARRARPRMDRRQRRGG